MRHTYDKQTTSRRSARLSHEFDTVPRITIELPVMRILLAHNFYQSSAPCGEDVVYRNERALLEDAGHEVIAFERHNDAITTTGLQRAGAALGSLWSRRSYAYMRRL